MKGEKQQTLLADRAKAFHELWKAGYSVADAAEKMGISKYTIYEQLEKYAEINGVESRSIYIKEYSTRGNSSKDINSSKEVEYSIQKSWKECMQDIKFDEIIVTCNTWMKETNDLIKSLDSVIQKYLSTINDKVKEEKV